MPEVCGTSATQKFPVFPWEKSFTALPAGANNGLRLHMGATEETIVARVGQGIVSTVGSMATHMEALEMPDRISKRVLGEGISSNTAYEIVSIDIAIIDVGENIGARLQSDQAEADTRIAGARAEIRRADAIALEQEMKAMVAANRAKLVLAETAIPKALARAFRGGLFYSSDFVALGRSPTGTDPMSRATILKLPAPSDPTD